MLESARGARLASEALLRRLVCDEARVENFDGHGALNQKVRRVIDRAHAAHAEPRVEPVLFVEDNSDERVGRRGVGDRGVGAKCRSVVGADGHVRFKLPTALRALEHKFRVGERAFCAFGFYRKAREESAGERKVFLCASGEFFARFAFKNFPEPYHSVFGFASSLTSVFSSRSTPGMGEPLGGSP